MVLTLGFVVRQLTPLLFRVRLIVQRQPSSATSLTTYYESIQATENFPPYAALDVAVTDNQASAVSIDYRGDGTKGAAL